LKHFFLGYCMLFLLCMNKQNPDRGIETGDGAPVGDLLRRMNKQNPDRGIETKELADKKAAKAEYEQTESRPRD